MRVPLKIVRHTRLPVWPAWQGLALVALSQMGPLRGIADGLESRFGGRVCPISLEPQEADPFVLLVHHRHAFRNLDFLRPVFSAAIMPEGFPAHPHRGFETVTYVLPGRGGLRHRDSFGCKMRYGNGAVQWMTAGRGMLHEEMWDVDGEFSDHELYQIWLNLPPSAKMEPPRVQLLGDEDSVRDVESTGDMNVRVGGYPTLELQDGRVKVRYLADSSGVAAAAGGPDAAGAVTRSPVTIAHVTLEGAGTSHELSLPEGWTCLAYVRSGSVDLGGGAVAAQYDMCYMGRDGGALHLQSTDASGADVLVLAGEPIGAPVVASGTMVMNTQAQVDDALRAYQAGGFGIPWDHTATDDEWRQRCEQARPLLRRS